MSTSPRLGFVGLGAVGAPMARRLLQAGHRVSVYDVAPGAVDALAPHQIIQHTRLERAHQELLRSNPEEATVAGIGARWGFPHAGRFACLYHARYGVYPSATLRDAGTFVWT